jgi:hypothetical protein
LKKTMPNPALEKLIGSLENDLSRSALLQKKVPALAEAFDAGRMLQILQDRLLDPQGHYAITNCVPGKALYLPGHLINMQYKLTIQDHVNHETSYTLINARLFPNLSDCKAYVDEKLTPIAARMADRPEIEPFARPIAILEHLNMALSAFPIDGPLPTLVDATDPHKIASILAESLPEASSGEFLIKDVQLLLAHYGRFERCVLRYSIDGLETETQTPQNRTVYGKVDGDGSGELTIAIISALRERLHEPEVPYRFRIPSSLGYFPELRLLLMEALPGKPFFKELLKTWLGNSHQTDNQKTAGESAVTLEQAVKTYALIAATLHGSPIELGPRNTLEMEVARLREETEVLAQVLPDLGAQVTSWIDQTVEFAQAYPAMPPCFSHGDFTYTQLIFDGQDGGLVDFDSICQAEPAQDLGHYLAYQRLNIIKDQDPNFPFAPEAIGRLCALFLDTYLEVSKGWIPDESLLRGRVAIYELIGLIGLTLHSWQKMKGRRLKQTLALLEERIECQRQISVSVNNRMP